MPAEARRRFEGAIDRSLLTAGAVTITQALGRVRAAETDVPAFDRAGVDGFAARATDTIGAGDPAPCGFCSMRSRARHLPGSVETIEAAGVELRASHRPSRWA
jgi:molybdopterin biosynthesis enzyme